MASRIERSVQVLSQYLYEVIPVNASDVSDEKGTMGNASSRSSQDSNLNNEVLVLHEENKRLRKEIARLKKTVSNLSLVQENSDSQDNLMQYREYTEKVLLENGKVGSDYTTPES